MMKTNTLVVILTLCLMVGIVGLQADILSTETVNLETWDSTSDFGPFVKHGKLVQKSAGNFGGYFYTTPSGKSFFLDNDVFCINEFLKDEINTKDLANKFVTEQLVRLLFSNICIGDPITKGWADEGWGQWPPENTDPVTKASIHKKLETKAKSYISDPTPVVVGNKWTVNVNAQRSLGGVVHFRATGTLDPLQITSYTIDVLEPDGTFFPTESM